MDVEWAKDGRDGRLYILQARPETVHSIKATKAVAKVYRLSGPPGDPIVTGSAVGESIGSGPARVVRDASELDSVQQGDVLVATTTNPDWEPVMKRSAAIITDAGGRTSHAAIVSREFGIPCIVGADNATGLIRSGQDVTVSCAEGSEGRVYSGRLPWFVEEVDASGPRPERTKVMVNVADPSRAFEFSFLPCDGVGLARMEFIVNNAIGVHPMALVRYPELSDPEAVDTIKGRIGDEDPREFFVRSLAEGVGRIAAAFHPRPVVVRMSDFKTNEYAQLVGGSEFEPEEENPMLGFRGASRYYDPRYEDGFALECEALQRVRDGMGLTNIVAMIPFCRTVEEGRQVIETMARHGLRQGDGELQIYVMCELPSNALNATAFLDVFDGFSIGSNDLTQLTLGIDRGSGAVAHLFDERDVAVKALIEMAIDAARRAGKPIGICGQAPSDFPDFAQWLVTKGISSISLNPDSVVLTSRRIADAEQREQKESST
jgi:pyruvate,water dikinase